MYVPVKCVSLTCRRGDVELVDPLVDMARDRHRRDARRPRARRLLRGPLDRRLQDHRATAAAQTALAPTPAATLAVAADAAVHCGCARTGAHAATPVGAAFPRQ